MLKLHCAIRIKYRQIKMFLEVIRLQAQIQMQIGNSSQKQSFVLYWSSSACSALITAKIQIQNLMVNRYLIRFCNTDTDADFFRWASISYVFSKPLYNQGFPNMPFVKCLSGLAEVLYQVPPWSLPDAPRMPKIKPKEAYLVPALKARLYRKVLVAKCLSGCAE